MAVHENDIDDSPPPYSEVLGQISESNDNIGTKATIARDGRVDIKIDQKSKKLSTVLSSVFKLPESTREDVVPEPYIPPSLGGSPGQVPPPSLNVVIHVVGSRGKKSFIEALRDRADRNLTRRCSAVHSFGQSTARYIWSPSSLSNSSSFQRLYPRKRA